MRFASRLAGDEAPIRPLTERTLGGIRREGRARGQVTEISFLEVQFLASKLEQDSVKGLRDANVLSVMSDCLLRVGELVDLLIRDIVRMDDQSTVARQWSTASAIFFIIPSSAASAAQFSASTGWPKSF